MHGRRASGRLGRFRVGNEDHRPVRGYTGDVGKALDPDLRWHNHTGQRRYRLQRADSFLVKR